MRRRILIIILVAGLIGGVAYAVNNQSADDADLAASGTIEASEVHVGAQAAGTLTKLMVDEGDRVKKGELLARIDDSIARSQVRQAEAAVAAADVRLEALPVATAEYRGFEATKRQAQAALDIARAQLRFTSISAPISGEVLTVPYAEGESLAPGGTVAVLANLDKLKVTVYVPEQQLGRVKIGRKVRITVDSFTDKTFTGRVTAIAARPEFTPTNVQTKEQRVKQVYAVKISVKNSRRLLKPGMPADVDLGLD